MVWPGRFFLLGHLRIGQPGDSAGLASEQHQQQQDSGASENAAGNQNRRVRPTSVALEGTGKSTSTDNRGDDQGKPSHRQYRDNAQQGSCSANSTGDVVAFHSGCHDQSEGDQDRRELGDIGSSAEPLPTGRVTHRVPRRPTGNRDTRAVVIW